MTQICCSGNLRLYQLALRLRTDRFADVASIVDKHQFRGRHGTYRKWEGLVKSVGVNCGCTLQYDLPVLQTPRSTRQGELPEDLLIRAGLNRFPIGRVDAVAA